MRVFSLTPKETFFAVISWKGLLAIALFLQFLVYLPSRLGSYVPELVQLVSEHRTLLNDTSLAALGLAILQFVRFVRVRVPKSIQESVDFQALAGMLSELSIEEKQVLSWYFEKDNKLTPQHLFYDSPGVSRLADADIIFQFSATGTSEGYPFLIKQWVWSYIHQHPEVLS